MKISAALTAALATLVAFPALAGMGVNGMGVNGMGVNGMGVNGMGVNGVQIQGPGINGLSFQGPGINGLRYNAYKLRGNPGYHHPAEETLPGTMTVNTITLPDGTVLVLE